jgi:Na+/H+ antiporter NhaD/arsenite permease-like protein
MDLSTLNETTKMTLGAPSVFFLFALMLAGVAVWHRHAMTIAIAGLVVVAGYRAFLDGLGPVAVIGQLGSEGATLVNLFLVLTGFQLVAHQFERSRAPDHLPHLLPRSWLGGVVLLAIVFVLSAFLDNIAAASIGGVAARHAYAGRVGMGFLAAVVAAANAGGAGSVLGDTTTTLMWLHGISPIALLPAYVAAVAAFAIFAVAGAISQHRLQPVCRPAAKPAPVDLVRLAAVALVLGLALGANVLIKTFAGLEGRGPWLGLAIWLGLALTSLVARPDWRVVRPAAKGAVFLVALVAAASLLPVAALPPASLGSTFGLGVVSAVFDNIPLTTLALRQGGYDWALLAFAVGFGGSMVWFGSSAGVALTAQYPQARSIGTWVRRGWFVPLGYAVGFAALVLLFGYRPTSAP